MPYWRSAAFRTVPTELKQASITRGYDPGSLSDLPASKDEVIAAEAAVHGPGDLLLIGPRATESAFKRLPLRQYDIIHLAVHGYASTTERNRSALVLLSDPAAGEDGFLQASEIVQLRLQFRSRHPLGLRNGYRPTGRRGGNCGAFKSVLAGRRAKRGLDAVVD